jgi:hypothetical protein
LRGERGTCHYKQGGSFPATGHTGVGFCATEMSLHAACAAPPPLHHPPPACQLSGPSAAVMALRRGFTGLVPRLLNTTEALAPICTSSSSLLQPEASSSSSGNNWGAYQSFLRGAWASRHAAQNTDPTSSLSLIRPCCACDCRLCLRRGHIEALRAVPHGQTGPHPQPQHSVSLGVYSAFGGCSWAPGTCFWSYGAPGTAAHAPGATWGMISTWTDAAAADGVWGDAGLVAACSGCRLVQGAQQMTCDRADLAASAGAVGTMRATTRAMHQGWT